MCCYRYQQQQHRRRRHATSSSQGVVHSSREEQQKQESNKSRCKRTHTNFFRRCPEIDSKRWRWSAPRMFCSPGPLESAGSFWERIFGSGGKRAKAFPWKEQTFRQLSAFSLFSLSLTLLDMATRIDRIFWWWRELWMNFEWFRAFIFYQGTWFDRWRLGLLTKGEDCMCKGVKVFTRKDWIPEFLTSLLPDA